MSKSDTTAATFADPEIRRRWITAFHEAAHAVVANHYGLKVYSVELYLGGGLTHFAAAEDSLIDAIVGQAGKAGEALADEYPMHVPENLRPFGPRPAKRNPDMALAQPYMADGELRFRGKGLAKVVVDTYRREIVLLANELFEHVRLEGSHLKSKLPRRKRDLVFPDI